MTYILSHPTNLINIHKSLYVLLMIGYLILMLYNINKKIIVWKTFLLYLIQDKISGNRDYIGLKNNVRLIWLQSDTLTYKYLKNIYSLLRNNFMIN